MFNGLSTNQGFLFASLDCLRVSPVGCGQLRQARPRCWLHRIRWACSGQSCPKKVFIGFHAVSSMFSGPHPQISWTKLVLYLMKHPHLLNFHEFYSQYFCWIFIEIYIELLSTFIELLYIMIFPWYPLSWFSQIAIRIAIDHDILNIHCFYLHLWSATCIDDGLQQRILADHVPSLDVYIGYGIFILVY